MTTATRKPSIHDLPKTYAELVAFFPPRPIRDDTDLDNTSELVGLMAGHQLTPDQEDYLDLLATLVETYEREHYPMPRRRGTPLENLKFLMQETDMTTADLGRLLGNSSLASQILRGRRGLSKAHIRVLADHFKVGAALFL